MKKWITLLLIFILLPLLATIAYYRFRFETESLFYAIFPVFARVAVDQPILFNHIHHKEVAKLNCTFCHRYVERNRVATIPNIELCRACHSTDAISKRPEAMKVVGYVKNGKTIPWKRMYELSPFVVFPHWIHVQNEVDCSVCHGVTGTSDRPVKMVDRNYMDYCIHCHEKRGASTDCYACHSS
jgi:c(7)-type cytochrome triheme protein